jgi:hypothetical protein
MFDIDPKWGINSTNELLDHGSWIHIPADPYLVVVEDSLRLAYQ